MNDEIDRQARVIDMMLTMHSVLRDRNAWRAAVLDASILVISALLCALTFADRRVLAYANVSEDMTRDIVSAAGVVVFALSIASLRVDWKQLSSPHQRACETLSRLKSELRVMPRGSETSTESVRRINEALVDVAAIPEKSFLPLKAKHLRKIELSRALSANPGAPLLAVRAMMFCRICRRLWGGEGNADANNGSS